MGRSWASFLGSGSYLRHQRYRPWHRDSKVSRTPWHRRFHYSRWKKNNARRYWCKVNIELPKNSLLAIRNKKIKKNENKNEKLQIFDCINEFIKII